MSTRYLLPCECGKKVEVEATQSGLSVACGCGRSLEVPTHRGLERLERVTAPAVRPSAGANWGPRQGLIFLGTVIIMAAVGYWAFLALSPPPDTMAEDIRSASPADSLGLWQVLRGGIQNDRDVSLFLYMAAREKRRFRTGVAIVAGVLGLAIAIAGLAIKPRREIPTR